MMTTKLLMLSNSALKLALIAPLIVILGACSGNKGDDLDKFMATAANDMGKGVVPLPEVLPYSPLQFNADGTLSDPFKARKASNKSGSLQPNTNRAKEDLESYPLESLKYVGFLSKNKKNYALVKSSENVIQQVKVGNYMGPNFGLITNISEGAIEIKEIIQDDLTGDWVERNSSINLQE